MVTEMKRVRGLVVLQTLLLLILLLPIRANATSQESTPSEENSSPVNVTEDPNLYFESYNAPISREGFCYLVVSLMAQQQDISVDSIYNALTDTQKNASFDDVTEENKYISIAKKYELINGIGDRSFNPLTEITRQEAAVILYNYINKFSSQHLVLYDGVPPAIEDHVEIAEWAEEAVDYMSATGLLPLDQNGNFDPLQELTVENAILLTTDFRVFIETEVPASEEQKSGIPIFVFVIIGVILGGTCAVALIVILRRRHKRMIQHRSEEEQRRMDALVHKIVPPSSDITPASYPASSAAFAKQREVEQEETVLLNPEQNNSVPQIRFADILGTAVNKTFPLDQRITIGRSPENVLKLSDPTVSGHHCKISFDGVRVILEKTGARNEIRVERGGTILQLSDGKPLSLLDGDILYLGALRIRVNLLYF
nr:S-layer homology domain-containing protein [uncultured Agathobaculum sp.]